MGLQLLANILGPEEGLKLAESMEDCGVVIVDKGVILTNLHVVSGADRVKVVAPAFSLLTPLGSRLLARFVQGVRTDEIERDLFVRRVLRSLHSQRREHGRSPQAQDAAQKMTFLPVSFDLADANRPVQQIP